MPGTVPRRTIAKGAAWSTPVIILAAAAPAARASEAFTIAVTDMWATYDTDAQKYTFSATISLTSGSWPETELDIDHSFYEGSTANGRPDFYWPLAASPTGGSSFVTSSWGVSDEVANYYTAWIYLGVDRRRLLASPDSVPITVV